VSVPDQLHAQDWDFPDSDSGRGIHSLHPYPAKFISDIPLQLAQILGTLPGTAILDPFCGAGTTLVVAQDLGIPSIGIDLNPIACLISRVKTSPLPRGLMRVGFDVAQGARDGDATAPPIPNVDHWFSAEAKQAIAGLVQQIGKIEDALLADHLRLALSSIIVRVSNQDSDTRYAAVEREISVRAVRNQFLAACARIEAAKRDRPPAPAARVIESDILTVTPDSIGAPVSLVVTSPPYPNAYEYWLYHKYRMWWLGFDPLAVKRREIGARPHYFKKNHATFDDFRQQMASVLQLLGRVMVPRGYACFVAGRSRIHGVDYNNAAMIAEEAERLGFTTTVQITRLIRATRKAFNLSHARIKTEEILVLQYLP
jgi:site-specific DNA-methyltransferase (cytosine-N4-specific)